MRKKKVVAIRNFQYISHTMHPNQVVSLDVKGDNLEELYITFMDILIYDDQDVFKQGSPNPPDFDLAESKWKEASSSIEVDYIDYVRISPVQREFEIFPA